ncbi:MAG: DUF4386 family protein [Nitrososphaerales archaeon]
MSKGQEYRGVYRVGGIFAIISGILGLLLLGLFVFVGPLPEEGGVMLESISSNNLLYRATFGFMLVFQLSFLPVIPSLYFSLRGVSRTHALFGGFISGIGAVLGVIWASVIYSLLSLSDTFVLAFGAERPALAAAAQIGLSLTNTLFVLVYAMLAIGLFLVFGAAMLKGVYAKWMGWLGILTGIVVLVAIIPPLNILFFVATVLMAAWFFGVGAKLLKS